MSEECLYYAPKHYLTENTDWPTAAICNDMSMEARTLALMEGPYGRCVYHCDNDVVDHQVVNMEFDNGVTVAFTMSAFTKECTRTIKLMGTSGEIHGHMGINEIKVIDFKTDKTDTIQFENIQGGHHGGDLGIMQDFVRLVQSNGALKGLTSADISVQSHIMAFAAEKARLTGSVVDIEAYMKELKE